MDTWISVKKKLPKRSPEQVIVNNYIKGAKEENVVICATFSEGKFYSLEYWGHNLPEENEEIRIKHVSHWMPLPSPPTSEL